MQHSNLTVSMNLRDYDSEYDESDPSAWFKKRKLKSMRTHRDNRHQNKRNRLHSDGSSNLWDIHDICLIHPAESFDPIDTDENRIDPDIEYLENMISFVSKHF